MASSGRGQTPEWWEKAFNSFRDALPPGSVDKPTAELYARQIVAALKGLDREQSNGAVHASVTINYLSKLEGSVVDRARSHTRG